MGWPQVLEAALEPSVYHSTVFISNHEVPQFIHAVALGLLTAALLLMYFSVRSLSLSLHLNKATLLRHSCRLLECRY